MSGILHGKMIISGILECMTGLHIGTASDSLEIGGIDNPVIRDPASRQPYIPGSSLKGKMRSLLEKAEFEKSGKSVDDYFSKKMQISGITIRHHECNDENCMICRLFGASRDNKSGVSENRPAALIVRDAILTEESVRRLEEVDTGLYLTEVKSENTLDRITSAANPRSLERVPRGAEFAFELVYNLSDELQSQATRKDLETIIGCLAMVEDDYLGGSGSRGSGKVRIKALRIEYRDRSFYFNGAEPSVEQADVPEGELLGQVGKELIQKLMG